MVKAPHRLASCRQDSVNGVVPTRGHGDNHVVHADLVLADQPNCLIDRVM
jgi:hypothetical protein